MMVMECAACHQEIDEGRVHVDDVDPIRSHT